MWKCSECGEVFCEPMEEHTSCEHYYGVGGMFGNSTPMTILVCPHCGSEDIDEWDEDEEEEYQELNEH